MTKDVVDCLCAAIYTLLSADGFGTFGLSQTCSGLRSYLAVRDRQLLRDTGLPEDWNDLEQIVDRRLRKLPWIERWPDTERFWRLKK